MSEGAADTDNDGVANYRDLDVDNDGIFDIIEVRIGMAEVNLLDTDLNGVIDFSYEYGANGMADVVETVAESGIENYTFPDIDGDSVLDWADLDSDNDGLLDTQESDHPDADLDGIIDAIQPAEVLEDAVAVDPANIFAAPLVDETGLAPGAGGVPRNSDNDALADFRDLDTDNDGISDIVESFGTSVDLDVDGKIDSFIDSDGNGVDDLFFDQSPVVTDTDSDGFIDALDLDSDGDGIADVVENSNPDLDGDGMLDALIDSNGDGWNDPTRDWIELLTDTDDDGLADFQDLDSDSDGRPDLQEGGAVDLNGDGIADEPSLGSALPDGDADGIPDFQQALIGTDGTIRTGLAGRGGCAITTPLPGAKRMFDPLLPLMVMIALLWITSRSKRRREHP